MDNNNPMPTPIPMKQEQYAPTAATQVPPAIMQKESSNGIKKIVVVIIGILIIGLFAGGVYYFLNNQQAAKVTTDTGQALVPQQLAAQPVAIAKQMDSIDTDLSSLKIDSIDSAMSEVDKSLKSL